MFRFSVRPLYLLVVTLFSFVTPTLDRVEGQQGALPVLSTIPTSNELTASVATTIWINFQEPIDPASVTNGSCWAIGRWSGPAEGLLEVVGGSSIRLTPDNPFSAGEQVMVIL